MYLTTTFKINKKKKRKIVLLRIIEAELTLKGEGSVTEAGGSACAKVGVSGGSPVKI